MVLSPVPNLRHLVSASSLSAEEIRFLLGFAHVLAPKVQEGQNIPLLQGKIVANLFFENSTRTRTSFEMAIRKLGAGSINFTGSASSLNKGESFIDTAKNLIAMSPVCLVVRHPSAGGPQLLTQALNFPVVNAGDGFHEHPTQALLDVFTIEQRLGTLENKNVVIMGDIAHSRVARSNIHIMNKLGARVSVCAPPTLLPPDSRALGVQQAYRPEDLLSEADVVMCLRIQHERQNRMQFPSIAEYRRFWGLNSERAKLLKDSAIIMHPGPINRGVELDPEVADGERSVILQQVTNGIVIRMAVLAAVCNPKGVAEFLKKEGHSV